MSCDYYQEQLLLQDAVGAADFGEGGDRGVELGGLVGGAVQAPGSKSPASPVGLNTW